MLPPSSEERRSRRGALRAEGRDDRQCMAQGETYEREGKEGTEALVPNMFDLIY